MIPQKVQLNGKYLCCGWGLGFHIRAKWLCDSPGISLFKLARTKEHKHWDPSLRRTNKRKQYYLSTSSAGILHIGNDTSTGWKVISAFLFQSMLTVSLNSEIAHLNLSRFCFHINLAWFWFLVFVCIYFVTSWNVLGFGGFEIFLKIHCPTTVKVISPLSVKCFPSTIPDIRLTPFISARGRVTAFL